MSLVTGANGNVGRRVVPVMIAQGFDVKVFDITPNVSRWAYQKSLTKAFLHLCHDFLPSVIWGM